jgi:uncharacterized membrane protein YjjP (DUF1212 family)
VFRLEAKHYLKIALFAGDIMISNGGEIYRIEDTITRILGKGGFKNIETFVTMTCIIASVTYGDDEPVTMVKKVSNTHSNLGKISLVNDFSREFVSSNISFDTAIQKLEDIDTSKAYPLYISLLSSGMLCLAASLMQYTNFAISIFSFIVGCFVYIVSTYINKRNFNSIISNTICGIIVTLCAFFLTSFNPSNRANIQVLVISSIMPLVPGLALTNSIRDMIDGHYLAGVSRFIGAFITAIGIAIGVTIGFLLYTELGGAFIW